MNIPAIIKYFTCLLCLLLFINVTYGGTPEWYTAYDNGLKAMQQQNYKAAADYFKQALKIKDKDSGKQRAMGTIFVKYYPHRELGICYYYLGNINAAIEELNLSMSQSGSNRAQQYLAEIKEGNHPEVSEPQEEETPPKTDLTVAAGAAAASPEEITSSEIIGDRMSIAVLPFDSKGLGNELGSIDLLDKLITGFVNLNRFKVIERALLEKILEEQKLGMSGIVDVSTAAEIGKGIGVDAVVVGSVTRASNAMSIDARFIDTETAAILTAKDAYSQRISLQDVSNMISILADKIKKELPILHGYVINVSERKITLDIGRSNGLKKGMKCHVYREGAPIVHPVTGKVIAKEIEELCEVQVIEVFDVYANAIIIQNKTGIPKVRDRIVTK
jgi:TolB-like protein